jgi:hypothetical protein
MVSPDSEKNIGYRDATSSRNLPHYISLRPLHCTRIEFSLSEKVGGECSCLVGLFCHDPDANVLAGHIDFSAKASSDSQLVTRMHNVGLSPVLVSCLVEDGTCTCSCTTSTIQCLGEPRSCVRRAIHVTRLAFIRRRVLYQLLGIIITTITVVDPSHQGNDGVFRGSAARILERKRMDLRERPRRGLWLEVSSGPWTGGSTPLPGHSHP